MHSKNEKVDHWGEPDPLEHDFTVEEMFDMPMLSDLQSEGSNIVFTRIEAEELFV